MKAVKSLKAELISFRFKKTLTLLTLIICFSNLLSAQDDTEQNDLNQKSTLLAVVLSMQPLPIDLGNAYAGNWSKAIVYSAYELAVFVPGVVMLSNGSNTSETDNLGIYTLLGIYFFTKVISAFDAGIQISFENNRIGYQTDRDVTAHLNFNVSL